MKTLFSSILVALCFSLTAQAIPQTFNNGFFGAVGQQFEDFAIAAVGPGEELKGKWAPVAGKDGVLRLDMTAVVFGVPASEVTVEKSGEAVGSFRVVYRQADDEKRPKQATSLRERVLAGIRAYAGSEANGVATYKGAVIKVTDAGKGDVNVEITKKP